jgi:hypothetical protein
MSLSSRQVMTGRGLECGLGRGGCRESLEERRNEVEREGACIRVSCFVRGFFQRPRLSLLTSGLLRRGG